MLKVWVFSRRNPPMARRRGFHCAAVFPFDAVDFDSRVEGAPKALVALRSRSRIL